MNNRTEWFKASLDLIKRKTGKSIEELAAAMPLHKTYVSKLRHGLDVVTNNVSDLLVSLAERLHIALPPPPAVYETYSLSEPAEASVNESNTQYSTAGSVMRPGAKMQLVTTVTLQNDQVVESSIVMKRIS